MIPDWYVLVLLALAAFRTWRIIGADVITRPIRERLIGRDEIGNFRVAGYRPVLDEFVHCPWCLGFWITLAWWGAWYRWPHALTIAAVPLALSAIVGLVGKQLDP